MELPPVPPGVDLSGDRRAEIVAVAVSTWLLAIIAVAMRTMGRKIKRVQLWIDDWLVIAALPTVTLHVFTMDVLSVTYGFGRHIWVGPPDAEKIWAICVFIGELTYITCMVCVKLSILAFYWRVFRVQQCMPFLIVTVTIMVSLWGTAAYVVTMLQCQPLNAWWARFDPNDPMPSSEYTCGVDTSKFFIACAFGTIAIDILLLALPAPHIWSLRLPIIQKLNVSGMFLLGLFVTCVSFARLKFVFDGVLKNPDNTWTFVDIAVWSIVELNITIVCACLPFLRPVLRKLTCGIKRHSQSGSSASLRVWESGNHFGNSRVRTIGSRVEADEPPFAYLPNNSSRLEQSSVTRTPSENDMESGGLTKPKSLYTRRIGTSSMDELVITREVHVCRASIS